MKRVSVSASVLFLGIILIPTLGLTQDRALESELGKRLEVQGVRLLIETKLLDEKMPKTTGIPDAIWSQKWSDREQGASLAILNVAAFVASGWSVIDAFNDPNPADASGVFGSILSMSSIVGGSGTSNGLEQSLETPGAKRLEFDEMAKLNHRIDSIIEKTVSGTAVIFDLDRSERKALKDAVKNEVARQLEEQIKSPSKNNRSIRIDTLDLLHQNGIVTDPIYYAAREIGALLARNKIDDPKVKSLGYGERQLQNLIRYLEDVNSRIDDRNVNAQVASVVDEAQRELDFVRSQK